MHAVVLSALLALPLADSLAPPFPVTVDGAVLDVPADEKARKYFQNGFPWFGDFDGDGKPDLLVGQSRGYRAINGVGGRLCIYRNLGELGRPRFGAAIMFDALVPTARIPDG